MTDTAGTMCICCCRPRSAHNDKGQCPEVTYFIANDATPTPAKQVGGEREAELRRIIDALSTCNDPAVCVAPTEMLISAILAALSPQSTDLERIERVAEAIYLAYCQGIGAEGARYDLVDERHKEHIWRTQARLALTPSGER